MRHERTGKLQVLLVEDDDIDATAFERALQRAQFDVDLVWCSSAEQALRVLTGKEEPTLAKPFLVLLDLNMPGMGGHGFLEALRAEEELRSTVVFVLSTSSAERDIEAAYRYQVAGYFVKDIDSGRNRQVVEALRAYSEACWLPGDG